MKSPSRGKAEKQAFFRGGDFFRGNYWFSFIFVYDIIIMKIAVLGSNLGKADFKECV